MIGEIVANECASLCRSSRSAGGFPLVEPGTPTDRQQGIVLVFVMLMLVVLTIFAVTTFQFGNTSLAISSNMQYRAESLSYAKETVNMTLSSAAFIQTPESALPPSSRSACPTTNTNRYCGDANGDGTEDYQVDLTPQPFCKSARTISNNDLDLTTAEGLTGAMGVSQTFGISGASSDDSLNVNSVWEITAVSTNVATGTTSTLRVGVKAVTPSSSCP
ncbi:MAG: hypothetical protein HW380_849 [Magnetococcales bacterium]|nr:hypothetical protein [Magnetococcales bacterium]